MVDTIELNCKRCGYTWEPRISNPKRCPRCQCYEWKENYKIPKIPNSICKQCGHRWFSRTDNPKKCPRCQSYKWNIDRRDNEIRHVLVSEETKLDVSALVRKKLKMET